MKRIVIILVAAIIGIANLTAQVNEKEEVYTKVHIKNKKPVPYVFVREGDVLWSKTVWRMVDLRQKMNMSIYFPVKPIGNRMNLIDLLLYGVKNEGLQVYDPDAPEATTEFDVLMTPEQIDVAMDALPDTILITDENGNQVPEITPGGAKTREILEVLLKEIWFFDKQHSVMNVRIVGMCPIRLYRKDDGSLVRKKTFWIYYPDARPLLVNHEIYNRFNDAQRVSFDDFFLSRRFEGHIWGESNVYNDRQVNEYTAGMAQLLEAERIEKFLFEMEHDLWVY